MKIVILDGKTFGDLSLTEMVSCFDQVDLYQTTSPEETAERVVDADVVVSNKVVLSREALEGAQHLKLICVAATGVNNVDLKTAASQGVVVTNVPGYSTPSVVSHTFGLYFALAHHMGYHDRYTKCRGWCESPVFTHLDRPYDELSGKTWGIIGLGAIGRAVAAVASAFGAKVIYHSASGRNLEQDYPHHDLYDLLAQSDVVSIHAPLNSHTRGLIDADALRAMNPRGLLINTGRGGIIVEADLADALNAGDIEGAGLDVMEVEPPESDNPLFSLGQPDRLLITPHIAGLSNQARQRLIHEIRTNIDAFFAGESRNRVLATKG